MIKYIFQRVLIAVIILTTALIGCGFFIPFIPKFYYKEYKVVRIEKNEFSPYNKVYCLDDDGDEIERLIHKNDKKRLKKITDRNIYREFRIEVFGTLLMTLFISILMIPITLIHEMDINDSYYPNTVKVALFRLKVFCFTMTFLGYPKDKIDSFYERHSNYLKTVRYPHSPTYKEMKQECFSEFING